MFCLSSWLGFVAHDVLKYLIGASTMAFVIGVVLAQTIVTTRKIQTAPIVRGQIAREISWSVVSATIFASVSMVGVFGLAELGWNQLYVDIAAFGWSYAGLSLVALIVAHDSYFYWLHRLLHVPAVLRVPTVCIIDHEHRRPGRPTALTRSRR